MVHAVDCQPDGDKFRLVSEGERIRLAHLFDLYVAVSSSTFTADTRSFASDLRDQRLVLIDGIAFARLMVEYSVCDEIKAIYQVARIDQDFFSEEE